MLTQTFGAGGDRDNIVAAVAVERHNIGQLWFAVGQSSRFVECQNVEIGGLFQVGAAFEETRLRAPLRLSR